jgi:hypothetical protein
MAPHTTTMVGVDQSMVGHIRIRMSSAGGVIGSLRFTGVRHRRFRPIMHRWTMNLSDGGSMVATYNLVAHVNSGWQTALSLGFWGPR